MNTFEVEMTVDVFAEDDLEAESIVLDTLATDPDIKNIKILTITESAITDGK